MDDVTKLPRVRIDFEAVNKTDLAAFIRAVIAQDRAPAAQPAPQEAPGEKIGDQSLPEYCRDYAVNFRRNDPWYPPAWAMEQIADALDRLAADLVAARADTDRAFKVAEGLAAERDAARAEAAGLRAALETMRSGLRNLPASATAVQLDGIAGAALSATPASADPREPGLRAAREVVAAWEPLTLPPSDLGVMHWSDRRTYDAARKEHYTTRDTLVALLDAELARLGAREGGSSGTIAGCQADDDGDCVWRDCPQLRDGEPKKSGRHCPRDRRER